MNAYTIVTNNGRIRADFDDRFEVLKKVNGGLEEIYDTLSELLQNGFRLISSPLPANVPLIRSPLRSIIVRKSERRYDAEGLLALEKARDRTRTLGVNTDPRVRSDLEMIDSDQLARAIRQLEAVFAAV